MSILMYTFLLQFFMELMKVPRVESKLRVFSFKIQFRSQVWQLAPILAIMCKSEYDNSRLIDGCRIHAHIQAGKTQVGLQKYHHCRISLPMIIYWCAWAKGQVLWMLSWGFSIGAGRKRNRLILHLVARVCQFVSILLADLILSYCQEICQYRCYIKSMS